MYSVYTSISSLGCAGTSVLSAAIGTGLDKLDFYRYCSLCLRKHRLKLFAVCKFMILFTIMFNKNTFGRMCNVN